MRPILPFSNHHLHNIPYQKRGSKLGMVVQSLPPGQFTLTNTVAVLGKLECIQEGAVARHGPGGFPWMSTLEDLSAMYDEIDTALACGKPEEAIPHLPEWTGMRSASWLNMSQEKPIVVTESM